MSSGLHTYTPAYTHTSIQKTDQKISIQFVLLKGQAFHCFWNNGVYETMVKDHKNSREDTATGVAMAIAQREHRMICYQILLWRVRVRVTFQASTSWRAVLSLAKTQRSGREDDCLKWISFEISKEACGPGSHSRKFSDVYRPRNLGITLWLAKVILRWFWVTTQTHRKPYWPSLFLISGCSSLGAFVLVLLCPQCLSCPKKKA